MIRIRRTIRRRRRRALAIGAVVLLALILAWEHASPAEHEMFGDGMVVAISICLAVIQGPSVLHLPRLAVLHGRLRPLLALRMPTLPVAPVGELGPELPRAGPDRLQVFLR